MERINTIIEQWHERIGPLQQKAVASRGAYLTACEQVESFTAVAAANKAAGAMTGGFLHKTFDHAFRAPALLHKKDLAQLGMQRDQFILDGFIVDTTARLAAALTPALETTAPTAAQAIQGLQHALDTGLKARQALDVAVISCAQASDPMQWSNSKYYFNALQRCENSARDLRRAEAALRGFNRALEARGGGVASFDDVSDIRFLKFGPEHSGTNNEKFVQAERRLRNQRVPLSAQIDDVKAELLDRLQHAAGALDLKTKAFDNMIAAAHQRVRPAGATIAGAPPKADF